MKRFLNSTNTNTTTAAAMTSRGNCCSDDTLLNTCCECGEEFEDEEDLVEVDGKLYCNECLEEYTVTCDFCGERVHVDSSETDDESTLCCRCAESYFCRCSECDRLVMDEDIYEDDLGNYLCHDCWEKLDAIEKCEELFNHSYKPQPIFHSLPEISRYLGSELEIDRNSAINDGVSVNSITKTLLALANISNGVYDEKVYLKKDSSLKFGFELVSHPMTLAYHLSSMPWNAILNYLLEKGFISNSSSTCGLHIHVNRDSFGKTTEEQDAAIARVLMFIENNWDKILKFSRRSEAQMNRWAAPLGTKEPGEIKKKIKDKSSSRYTCVNLNNKDTVEFRMFKGTLNYTAFAAALELVDAMCGMGVTYTDDEAQALSWADFVKSLDVKKYKELTAYLKERYLFS